MHWLRRSRWYLLLAVLAVLQYDIWLGAGGVASIWRLRAQIASIQKTDAEEAERNAALAAEIADLKANGLASAQEAARSELGMVRHDEIFYQVFPGAPENHPYTPYPDGPGTGYGKEAH